MDAAEMRETIEDLRRLLGELEADLPARPSEQLARLLALRGKAINVISATLVSLST